MPKKLAICMVTLTTWQQCVIGYALNKFDKYNHFYFQLTLTNTCCVNIQF